MLEFNPSSLQPGEIAFCLQTNHLVSASRFADFLRALDDTESAHRLPRHDIEIVALATGSIFGKVRVHFRHDIGSPDVGHARTDLERAANRQPDTATETLASIDKKLAVLVEEAKAARSDGVEAKWATRAALIIAAMSLVSDWTADARGEESPGSCATLVADLMEHDGVSDIDLWCDGHHVRIGRNDVPAYQHRLTTHDLKAEGISTGPPELGRPEIRSDGAAVDKRVPRAINLDDEGIDASTGADMVDATIPWPGSAHFPSSADQPPPINWHDRAAQTFDPASKLGELVERSGIISIHDRVLLLTSGPYDPSDRPAVVVPPGSYTVGKGDRVIVRGKLYRLTGPQDMIVADTVLRLPEDRQ